RGESRRSRESPCNGPRGSSRPPASPVDRPRSSSRNRQPRFPEQWQAGPKHFRLRPEKDWPEPAPTRQRRSRQRLRRREKARRSASCSVCAARTCLLTQGALGYPFVDEFDQVLGDGIGGDAEEVDEAEVARLV